MHITDILLVGIEHSRLGSLLSTHGYNSLSIDHPDRCKTLSRSFSVVIIDESAVEDWETDNVEQLYFLTDMTPVLILLHDISIPDSLARLIVDGTFDYLYEHEIYNGLAIKRIERTYLFARTDNLMRSMQNDTQQLEEMKRELELRTHMLAHEKEISSSILSSIEYGLMLIDPAGTIVIANRKANSLFEANSLVGSHFSSLPCDRLVAFAKEFCKPDKHNRGDIPTVQCSYRERILSVSAFMLRDCSHASGILFVISDITDQENLNSQLYRAEKLATVGTMLSGIAHELRNPLTVISGRTQRALSKLSPESEKWLISCLNSIDQQVRRCAWIVNGVLDFTRITANTTGEYVVSQLLDESLGYLAYQHRGLDLKINKSFDTALMIRGDRSRLIQLFLNILGNAAQAMNSVGQLSVACELTEESMVLITISDTGPGIDPEHRNKIFDPFFTTKDPGQGTGLGLAISFKIAQQNGGTIRFTSKPGDTKFFIELPSGGKQADAV